MENMQLVYTTSLNNEKLRNQMRCGAIRGQEEEKKKEKDEKKEKRVRKM